MPERVRPERVGQEIQAAVADLLLRGMIRDPRVGFITVTGVKVTPDLRTARVFWSMIGTDEQKKDCAEGLEKARRERELEGERKVALKAARLLLQENMPLSLIVRVTGLSETEIAALQP